VSGNPDPLRVSSCGLSRSPELYCLYVSLEWDHDLLFVRACSLSNRDLAVNTPEVLVALALFYVF